MVAYTKTSFFSVYHKFFLIKCYKLITNCNIKEKYMEDKNEFFTLDFDVALNHCVLVEWPELMEEFFPKKRIEITFKENRADNRNVKICLLGFNSSYYKEIWKLLKKKFLKH